MFSDISDKYNTSNSNFAYATFTKLTTNLVTGGDVTGKKGSKTNLTATLTDENNSPLEGKIVEFYVNGTKIGEATTDASGIAKLSYDFTDVGTVQYNAVFAEEDNYFGKTSSNSTITTDLGDLTITIYPISGKFNDTIILNATVLDQEGNPVSDIVVEFYVNNINVANATTDATGYASIDYTIVNAGDFDYHAIAVGSDDYNTGTTTNTTANFAKLTTNLIVTGNVSGKKGNKVNLTATLTDENGIPLAGKTVNFNIDGTDYSLVTDENGTAIYTFDYTNIGTIQYYVAFVEEDNYLGNTTSNFDIETNKGDLTIIVNDVSGRFNDTIILNATVVDQNGAPVSGVVVEFYIDNNKIGSNTTNDQGIAYYEYYLASAGNFVYKAIALDNENYTGNISTPVVLSVSKLTTAVVTNGNVNGKKGSSVDLIATLTDENGVTVEGKTVKFYVNGVYAGEAITDVNGIAKITYALTTVGGVDYNAIFEGDGNYSTFTSANSTLTTNKGDLTINITSVSGKFNDTIVLNANVVDQAGHPVSGITVEFYINGVNVANATTDENGVASFNYNINLVGTFDYSAIAAENENYTSNTSNLANATFAKGDLTIVVVDVSGKYNGTVILNATVVDQNNAPVSGITVNFYINGVNVGSNTTNDQGIAYYNYKVTNAGSFSYNVISSLNEYYNIGSSNYAVAEFTKLTTTIVTTNIDGKKGSYVNLTATLKDENGIAIEGQTVKFYVNGELVGQNTTDANGIARFSYALTSVGTVQYNATFEGDENYFDSNSTNSTITTALGDLSIVVVDVSGKFNGTVHLNTTVVDQEGNPISGILVEFYINGVNVGNATSDSNGNALFIYTIVNAGNFDYHAIAIGNEDYTGTNSNNASAAFSKLTTVITVTSGSITGKKGDTKQLTVILTNENGIAIEGQTVEFYVNGELVGQNTTDVNGVAVYAYKLKTVGDFEYNATFLGDENYFDSNSTNSTITTNVGDLTIIVVDVSGKFNDTIVLNATVIDQNGAPVSGIVVDFYIGDNKIGSNTTNDQGIAYYEYYLTSAGNFVYKAIALDNENYTGNISDYVVLSVSKLTTTVVTTNVIGKKGSSVDLIATLTDENNIAVVGKTVKFYVNGVYAGSAVTDVDGVAKISHALTTVGVVDYNAIFEGDGNYSTSTSVNSTITTGKGDLTIIVVDVSGKFGNTIVLNASVVDQSGVPVSGLNIEFYIGNINVGNGTTDEYGIASFNYNINLVGNFAYYAIANNNENYTYEVSNDANTTFIKGDLTIIVDDVSGKFNDTVILNASVVDQAGNLVSGININFYINGIYVGSNTTNDQGIAYYYYNVANAGEFDYYTGFLTNGNYNNVNSNHAIAIFDKLNTTITIGDIVSGKVGSKVNLTATLKDENNVGVEGKTVKFYVNGVYYGSVITDVNGLAKISYNITTVGNFVYNATFEGDNNYNTNVSDNSAMNFIKGDLTITVENITAKFNENTVLNVTVVNQEGNPVSGITITLYIDGIEYVSTTTNDQGIASFNYKVNTTGEFDYYAGFIGNNGYNANNSDYATLNLIKADTSIVVSNVSVEKGNSVNLTATLTDGNNVAIVGKIVKFYLNGELLGEAVTNANGIAKFTYSNQNIGSYNYYAVFAGDENYTEYNSTGKLNGDAIVNVTKKSVIVTIDDVSGKLNGTVVLNATVKDQEGNFVSGVVVEFYIGNVKVGTGTTNTEGIASFTYTIASAGNFDYHAISVGNENYTDGISDNNTAAFAKLNTGIVVNNVSVKRGVSVSITATLTDENGDAVVGKLVKFYLNGVYYGNATTDVDGVARISYTSYSYDAITTTAEFIEDGNYTVSKNNGKIATINSKVNWNVNNGMAANDIQSVINKALANDAVIFAKGTYNGLTLIISKTLELKANGIVTLNGVSKKGTAFTINSNAAGTIINGFTIQNYQNGINNKANSVNIINNNINSNAKYGIYTTGKNTVIQKNTLKSNKYAIRNTAKSTIKHNTLTSNTYGIYNTGKDTILYKNNLKSNARAIYTTAKSTIKYNDVRNNKYGIMLSKSAKSVTIYANTAYKNSNAGIYVLGSKNKISKNTITYNKYGIYNKGTKNTISKNTFKGNKKNIGP